MGQIVLAWVGQKVASPSWAYFKSIEQVKESIVTDIVLTPEEVSYLEVPCPKGCSGSSLTPRMVVDVGVYPCTRFFPETADRSLEVLDMEVTFALAYNKDVSPVALERPPAGSPEADRILGIQSRAASGRDSGERT